MDAMLMVLAGFLAGALVGVAGAHTRAAWYKRQRNSYRTLWRYQMEADRDS